jgi:chemotaxis protein CheZ
MKAAHDAKAAPELIHQLGEITRQLHQSLQQLGLMPQLQQSAAGLPDAHGRLDFIANKNAAAAERVLSVVEQAQQEQRALRKAARQMAQCCGVDPARQLPAAQVLAFAGSVEAASARIDQQLTDIMLAQDFHDLTGQVLAKLAALVTDLDGSLQRLQVRALAPARPGADVLHSQGEVDDLLARLGL